jgi:tight adherence protein B
MLPGTLTKIVFLAASSLALAVWLVWWAGKVAAAEHLRRRLGKVRAPGEEGLDGVLAGQGVGIARLLAESGLGWTMGMFTSRVAIVAGLGFLFGTAINSPGFGVMVALLGAAGVWMMVRGARARRLGKCDEQMPQALEIIALAMRAGHPLPRALELAASDSPAPLCHEFRRACDELALGRPVAQVMENFGAQLPGCESVNTFVVAVLVLQETGGNLIEVIDRIIENARARAGYQARLRALTAEGRQSARLLGAMPAVFMVLAMASDPSYKETLLYDAGGRKILLVAALMWATGIFWTRRLIKPMT